MDINEIDDFAETNTVEQVTDRAGKDQRQSQNMQTLMLADPAQVPEDADGGQAGDADKKRHPKRMIGKNAEGGSLIPHVGDIEKVFDDRQRLVQGKMAIDVV